MSLRLLQRLRHATWQMGPRLYRKQCATGTPSRDTTYAILRRAPVVRPGTDALESGRAGKYLF